mmetsp:Transcript_13883/g.28308  ORF Transcript_13883/g.28308 Transcript_13883/m.28308 type:complete len:83 (-) Transcript_13883:168-416(-)
MSYQAKIHFSISEQPSMQKIAIAFRVDPASKIGTVFVWDESANICFTKGDMVNGSRRNITKSSTDILPFWSKLMLLKVDFIL